MHPLTKRIHLIQIPSQGLSLHYKASQGKNEEKEERKERREKGRQKDRQRKTAEGRKEQNGRKVIW